MIRIQHRYMPYGIHQINMLHVYDHAYTLHLLGMWDDCEYHVIASYIQAYIEMENAPMPSGFRFLSPLSTYDGTDRWVYFTELCHDIEYDYEFTIIEQMNEGSHIIFDDNYDEDATIATIDVDEMSEISELDTNIFEADV